MAFINLGLARGAAPDTGAAARWSERALAVALPLLLILAWTAAVRLPFAVQTDKDEFFFSVIASEWLRGGLPYVAAFDIKPPGIFLIYAAVQAAFGASLAVIKGMEIVAVALAGWGLYGLVRRNGSQRAALWAAILLPVYSLTLGGAIAVSMLLLLPFVIAAFAAALAAVRDDSSVRARLWAAFLAGLAIGAAGMIRQTAVFEATAVFLVLCIWGGRRMAWRLAGLFVVGAALPALGFALYYLANGHFAALFNDVILLAMKRTGPDVVASYGPKLAYYFTTFGTISNVTLTSGPLIFLWAGGIFAVLRYRKLTAAFPARLLIVAGLWLAASFAGVVFSRGLCSYYLLAIVPPLLIVAGALFCHGLDVPPVRLGRAFVVSVLVAAATMIAIDRRDLFAPTAFLAGDYRATEAVSRKLVALGLQPGDHLLVLNRGFAVYLLTGAKPATPYFHPTQLLGVFHTPVADPLAVALAGNARFVVYANPAIRHVTEQPGRLAEAADYLAAHYRQAAVIHGTRDSYIVYQFAG